jgi:hypothetical protein
MSVEEGGRLRQAFSFHYLIHIMSEGNLTLTAATPPGQALLTRVNDLYEAHGADMSMYPMPKVVYAEDAALMFGYGKSEAKRKAKHRNLYNRFITEIFTLHGKFSL